MSDYGTTTYRWVDNTALGDLNFDFLYDYSQVGVANCVYFYKEDAWFGYKIPCGNLMHYICEVPKTEA